MKIVSLTPEEEQVIVKLRRDALKAKAGEVSREVVRAEDNEVVFCRATSFESPVLAAAKDWAIGEKTEFMFMPAGVHTICAGFRKGSIELTVKCDESTAQAVQASLDGWRSERPKQECYGCVEHREAEASVRVSASCGFSWRGDGVYLAAEPTKLGVENVNGRIHRSWSPSFTTDADYSKAKDQNGMLVFPEGVRGSRSNPAEITGIDFVLGTITNKPAFREMSPVKARESATVTAAWSDEARRASALARKAHAALDQEAMRRTQEARNLSDKAKHTGLGEDHQAAADKHEEADMAHVDAAKAAREAGDHGSYTRHHDYAESHFASSQEHKTSGPNNHYAKASEATLRAHCAATLLQDVPDATKSEIAQYEKEVDGGGSHSDAVIRIRSERQNGFATSATDSAENGAVRAMWSDAARKASAEARKASAEAHSALTRGIFMAKDLAKGHSKAAEAHRVAAGQMLKDSADSEIKGEKHSDSEKQEWTKHFLSHRLQQEQHEKHANYLNATDATPTLDSIAAKAAAGLEAANRIAAAHGAAKLTVEDVYARVGVKAGAPVGNKNAARPHKFKAGDIVHVEDGTQYGYHGTVERVQHSDDPNYEHSYAVKNHATGQRGKWANETSLRHHSSKASSGGKSSEATDKWYATDATPEEILETIYARAGGNR